MSRPDLHPEIRHFLNAAAHEPDTFGTDIGIRTDENLGYPNVRSDVEPEDQPLVEFDPFRTPAGFVEVDPLGPLNPRGSE